MNFECAFLKIIAGLHAVPPTYLGAKSALHPERLLEELKEILWIPSAASELSASEPSGVMKSVQPSALLCLRLLCLHALFTWVLNDEVFLPALRPFLDFLESASPHALADLPPAVVAEQHSWEECVRHATTRSEASASLPPHALAVARLTLLAALPQKLYREAFQHPSLQAYHAAVQARLAWEEAHRELLDHPLLAPLVGLQARDIFMTGLPAPPSLKQASLPSSPHITPKPLSANAGSPGTLQLYEARKSWPRLVIEAVLSPLTPKRPQEANEATSEGERGVKQASGSALNSPAAPTTEFDGSLPPNEADASDEREGNTSTHIVQQRQAYEELLLSLGKAYGELSLLPSLSGKGNPLESEKIVANQEGLEWIRRYHALARQWSEQSNLNALEKIYGELDNQLRRSSLSVLVGEKEGHVDRSDLIAVPLNAGSSFHTTAITSSLSLPPHVKDPAYRASKLCLSRLIQITYENFVLVSLEDGLLPHRHYGDKYLKAAREEAAIIEEKRSAECAALKASWKEAGCSPAQTVSSSLEVTSEPASIAISTAALREYYAEALQSLQDPLIFRYWMLSCLVSDRPSHGPRHIQQTEDGMPVREQIREKWHAYWASRPTSAGLVSPQPSPPSQATEASHSAFFQSEVVSLLHFPHLVVLVDVHCSLRGHRSSDSDSIDAHFDAVVYDATNEKILCAVMPCEGLLTRAGASSASQFAASLWIQQKKEMWTFIRSTRQALQTEARSSLESSMHYACEGLVSDWYFHFPGRAQDASASGGGSGKHDPNQDDAGVRLEEELQLGSEAQLYAILSPPLGQSTLSIPLHAWEHALAHPLQFFRQGTAFPATPFSLSSSSASLCLATRGASAIPAVPLSVPPSSSSALATLWPHIAAFHQQQQKLDPSAFSASSVAFQPPSALSASALERLSLVAGATPPPLSTAWSPSLAHDSFALLLQYAWTLLPILPLPHPSERDAVEGSRCHPTGPPPLPLLLDALMKHNSGGAGASSTTLNVLERIRVALLEWLEKKEDDEHQKEGSDEEEPKKINTWSYDEVDFASSAFSPAPLLLQKQLLQRECSGGAGEKVYWEQRMSGGSFGACSSRSPSLQHPRRSGSIGSFSSLVRRSDGGGDSSVVPLPHRRAAPKGDELPPPPLSSLQEFLPTDNPPSPASSVSPGSPVSCAAFSRPNAVPTPLQVLADLLRRSGKAHPLLETARKRSAMIAGPPLARTSRAAACSWRSPVENLEAEMAAEEDEDVEVEVEVAWF